MNRKWFMDVVSQHLLTSTIDSGNKSIDLVYPYNHAEVYYTTLGIAFVIADKVQTICTRVCL